MRSEIATVIKAHNDRLRKERIINVVITVSLVILAFIIL